MRALGDRMRSIDGRRLDVLVAVAILIELELEIWLHGGLSQSQRALTTIAAVLLVAPLGTRRRWPAAALIGCAAIPTIQDLVGGRLGAITGLNVPGID